LLAPAGQHVLFAYYQLIQWDIYAREQIDTAGD
jgi:hypothetical protein